MGEFLASNFQAFVHRGNAKFFRENTIEAFQSAKEIGFNYLETDLRITKDDKIITFHDPTLLRTFGENIQLRRVETIDFNSDMQIGSYLHSDSKLGAIVSINGGNEQVAKDIAMHVAAFNPLCLSRDDISIDLLEREKAIFENQAKDSGKPKEIMEKMIEGKIKRFLSEVSLLSQSFVKDSEITIEEYLVSNGASIVAFARLKVGEGIEVQTKDFAEEVAEQLK